MIFYKRKFIINLIATAFLMVLFFNSLEIKNVQAVNLKEQVNQQLNVGAEKSGLKLSDSGTVDIRIMVAGIIKTLMTAYGIIFVILTVVAGYMLITAQGEEEKIKKAHKIIIGAFIGLAIILSAYGISHLVASKAIEATGYGVY